YPETQRSVSEKRRFLGNPSLQDHFVAKQRGGVSVALGPPGRGRGHFDWPTSQHDPQTRARRQQRIIFGKSGVDRQQKNCNFVSVFVCLRFPRGAKLSFGFDPDLVIATLGAALGDPEVVSARCDFLVGRLGSRRGRHGPGGGRTTGLDTRGGWLLRRGLAR